MNKPVGHNCMVTPTSEGGYLVQSRNTGPWMQTGRFAGRGPFHVVKNFTGQDIVRIGRERSDDGSSDSALSENDWQYFYFALRAEWSHTDADNPANDFTNDTGVPFYLDRFGNFVDSGISCMSGKRTRSDPPNIADSPYQAGGVASGDICFLPKFSDMDSVHTLNTLWFYRGSLTAVTDETLLTGPAAPGHQATLTAGSWQVLFDVYEVDDGVLGAFVETKTYGGFIVPSSADPSDHTTWASLTVGDFWTCTGVDLTSPRLEYMFKDIRIEKI